MGSLPISELIWRRVGLRGQWGAREGSETVVRMQNKLINNKQKQFLQYFKMHNILMLSIETLKYHFRIS